MKPPEPSILRTSGHYASYFREEGVWYRSDDLQKGTKACEVEGMPSAFPYVCFFERVGQPEVDLPDLQANLVEVVATDDDESSEPDDEGPGERVETRSASPEKKRRM